MNEEDVILNNYPKRISQAKMKFTNEHPYLFQKHLLPACEQCYAVIDYFIE